MPVSTDFDFQIALARWHGANFAKLNFHECSDNAAWCFFFAEIALARRRGASFAKLNFQKRSVPASFHVTLILSGPRSNLVGPDPLHLDANLLLCMRLSVCSLMQSMMPCVWRMPVHLEAINDMHVADNFAS